MPHKTLLQRFESFIARDLETGCWLWRGHKNAGGYGLFSIGKKGRLAHRVSYELYKDPRPLPSAIAVCHACDRPACVNPAHLFLGTQGDNVRDHDAKRRVRFGARSHKSKLSFEQASEIRALFAQGFTAPEIAPRYGVAHSTIYAIKHGRSWDPKYHAPETAHIRESSPGKEGPVST